MTPERRATAERLTYLRSPAVQVPVALHARAALALAELPPQRSRVSVGGCDSETLCRRCLPPGNTQRVETASDRAQAPRAGKSCPGSASHTESERRAGHMRPACRSRRNAG